MAKTLDQMLGTREAVLWRKTDGKWGSLGFWAFGLGSSTLLAAGKSGSVLTQFLGFFLFMLVLRLVRKGSSGAQFDTVVTASRILHHKALLDGFELKEIAVEDVTAVEVLPRALRITRRGGKTVLFHPVLDAPLAGRALAEAAGLPPPRKPARHERWADEAVMLPAIALFSLGITGAFKSESLSALLQSVWLEYPIALLLSGLLFALGAWGGLLALRLWFDRDQIRAWMQQSELFGPNPKKSNRVGLFRRLSHWLVDLAFDPPPVDAKPPAR